MVVKAVLQKPLEFESNLYLIEFNEWVNILFLVIYMFVRYAS